ncbi:MAG: histidine ammonia-lyase [Candidatus Dormibacteria bacterium]
MTLGPGPLTLDEVVRVAREGARVSVAAGLDERLAPSRELVETLVAGERPVYGINTGFGALSNRRIEASEAGRLQESLLRSHAAGVGDPLAPELVRAMMLIRAAALSRGYSGVRPELVRAIVEDLNDGRVASVPSIGSLGASGDLAQLAHTFLPLIGEGTLMTGEPRAQPMHLAPKEGLALTNGTDAMLAAGVLLVRDVEMLLVTADVIAAMSVESLLGTDRPFQARLHALRPHPGQRSSASNLLALLAGSSIVASHRDSDHAVQDAYSLRCTPQVHGACRDTVSFARQVFERELASVIDNPVIFPEDGEVISGGNFHGEALAIAHDMIAIAIAEIAAISERRLNRLLDPQLSGGLPAFLSPRSGVNSGFMLIQYTAVALITEMRLLAAPASVHSIPTSAEQEDHVSMGWTAALKVRRSLDHGWRVLGAELLAAAQAIELRAPLTPSPAAAAVTRVVRSRVRPMGEDRPLDSDLEACAQLCRDGSVQRAAAGAVEQLA